MALVSSDVESTGVALVDDSVGIGIARPSDELDACKYASR